MQKMKIILSAGGTGGHIYPAVAVAQALQKRLGDGVELLFVGAEGKMEMEKVPALGYRIEGLPVAGLQRRLTPKNLLLPFRVAASLRKARGVIRAFGADVVVGFGGYASAPVLWSAQRMGIPTLIQEQNSYAGLTNKLLAKRAQRICVAYDGMEAFFPADKIIHTGNPLRGSFGAGAGAKTGTKTEDETGAETVTGKSSHKGQSEVTAARAHFGLEANRPVVLVVGGSLGTRTLNEVMKAHVDRIVAQGTYQVIWQTGKYYEQEMDTFMSTRDSRGVWRGAFIDRMDLAYMAADVVVSRSGAGTVSELCLVGCPTIFVPSPNVAEDHQTKNARALVDVGAAAMVTDKEAVGELFPAVERLLQDPDQRAKMQAKILTLGIADSADRVAAEVIRLGQEAQKKK